MTRREAKDILFLDEDGFFVQDALVDKIYDDFESRTCGNCKWNYKDNQITCETGVERPLHFKSIKQFSCSEWEEIR